ncbi:MAG: hypothetical protein ABFR36_10425 [Acidobacteriota bacterium]
MRIGKNLIPAVLILSFILTTGLSADRNPGPAKGFNIPHAGKKVPGKTAGSFSPYEQYFFYPGNSYIYWLSPDIITDIKKMIKKKEQARRTARSGNVKQMFSIMHL